MDLFLLIMTTFLPLFPNLSKIERQASDSVILLKPNKKTTRTSLSILMAFSWGRRGNLLEKESIPCPGVLKWFVVCAWHHDSAQH